MALSMKFHTDRLARDSGQAPDVAAAARKKRPQRERQIEKLVKEAIGRAATGPAEQSRLERLLQERLDDDDIRRDLACCSLGELILRICKGLGIEPDLRMWALEGWAQAEARDKTPGSPYAETDRWSWENRPRPVIRRVWVGRAADGTWIETPDPPDPPGG
jgi:hypothetical protein